MRVRLTIIRCGGSLGSSGKTWASERERNRAEHCVFLEPVPECYSLVRTFNVTGICESCYNFIGAGRIARACSAFVMLVASQAVGYAFEKQKRGKSV